MIILIQDSGNSTISYELKTYTGGFNPSSSSIAGIIGGIVGAIVVISLGIYL
jgi:hypothetical protein